MFFFTTRRADWFHGALRRVCAFTPPFCKQRVERRASVGAGACFLRPPAVLAASLKL